VILIPTLSTSQTWMLLRLCFQVIKIENNICVVLNKQLCGIIFCFVLLRQTKQHQWSSNTFHIWKLLFWNFVLQFLCFEQEGSLRPAMCWCFLLWEGKCLSICALNITCLICFISLFTLLCYSFVPEWGIMVMFGAQSLWCVGIEDMKLFLCFLLQGRGFKVIWLLRSMWIEHKVSQKHVLQGTTIIFAQSDSHWLIRVIESSYSRGLCSVLG
jgi:hypothetical protein